MKLKIELDRGINEPEFPYLAQYDRGVMVIVMGGGSDSTLRRGVMLSDNGQYKPFQYYSETWIAEALEPTAGKITMQF